MMRFVKSMLITPLSGTRRGFRQFKREDGAVTVEAALWLPFFVIAVTVVADAALIFYGQARTLQIAQDANRAYSTGNLASTDAAAEYIKVRLGDISPNAEAQMTWNDGLVTTVVTVPTEDLAAVGMLTTLTSIDMRVTAQMVKEF